MDRRQLQFDPFSSDSARWGFSLAQLAELIVPCLDAIAARSVAEIGAFAGDLTGVLVQWAAGAGAQILAIDPNPRKPLVRLDKASAELVLIRQPSLAALAEIPLPDAVIIDGDHNYYTVSQELKTIGERAAGAALPLLLFHDVCWPHGRRDDYFDEQQIPAEYRRPVAGKAGGLYPGDSGVRPGALPYPRSAVQEGGARNGVLTAVEEFAAARPELRLVVVPAFFGFGVVWHPGRSGAERLEQILEPWDRNPILERLEANRVHHLAESHLRQAELAKLRKRSARQEQVLRRQLESRAFVLAERLSRFRARLGIASKRSVVGREEVRRALGEG